MRVLIAFTAGFLVSAALWVYLDLQAPIARPAATELRDLPRATRPPPASEIEATPEATPKKEKRARRSAPRAESDDTLISVMPRDARETASLADPLPEDIAEAIPEQRPSARPRREGLTFVIAAGGGVETSLDSRLEDTAALLGIRLLVEPDRRLGLELGVARSLAGDGARTSVDGLVKWHLRASKPVRPYAAAGLGWRRRHGAQANDTLTIPIGVGVAYRHGRWFADGRMTLRPSLPDRRHSAGASAFVGIAF